MSLADCGAGVDQLTLNTTNVELYRTRDNLKVAGTVGTSGGGDAMSTSPVCSWMQIPTTPLKSPTSGMSSVLPSSLTAGHSIQEPAPAWYYSRVNFTKSMAYGCSISSSHQSRRQQALCCWFRWQRAPYRSWWQSDEPRNLFILAAYWSRHYWSCLRPQQC